MNPRAPHSPRLPVGAELRPDGSTHFRVWAPVHRRVRVCIEGDRPALHELSAETNGYFSASIAGVGAGTRYRYLLGDDEHPYPDPASRFQPDGPHGASMVVDPDAYRWTDQDWRGLALDGQVIYELHVGTFTREGTWAAAARELPALAELGITVVEVMPVAEFPGRFGWGYDGVDLFAPTRLYGMPDDFRRFVNDAHRAGIGVVLDVVYNHLGPSGNYLKAFSPRYFSDRHETEWGEPLNFDDEDSAPVRALYVANAGYWIDEFHLDGLRLDATQSIFDDSPVHILREIEQRVRAAAKGRRTLLIAENEPQHARIVRPDDHGGLGLDMMWNDDWHHSAFVALTGRREAYYTPHAGRAQEFVSAAKHGTLYQGQVYFWQRQRRGTPALDIEPAHFVHFLQNHDQVANTTGGVRCHTLASAARHRAMTAMLLLGPQTPMLFQGQEFASSAPFHYFADHEPELAAKVSAGRSDFVSQFPTTATQVVQGRVPEPHDPATFEACKLDFAERERHRPMLELHRDLLRLRREDRCLTAKPAVDGAVLAEHAFVLRFFAGEGDDRLLVVNLGPQLALPNAPEPLLAPPEGMRWRLLWSSEDPRYGGLGTPAVDSEEAGWQLLPDCAVLLAPEPAHPDGRKRPDRRRRPERRAVPTPFA